MADRLITVFYVHNREKDGIKTKIGWCEPRTLPEEVIERDYEPVPWPYHNGYALKGWPYNQPKAGK